MCRLDVSHVNKMCRLCEFHGNSIKLIKITQSCKTAIEATK